MRIQCRQPSASPLEITRSYDVFDTCLVRTCAFPSDVFIQVANRLKEVLRPIFGVEYALGFRDARIQAEKNAHRLQTEEEVTLTAIWSQVAKLVPGVDPENGATIEMETEASVLEANDKTLRTIREQRQQGAKIIYISDSYLPSGFIRKQLWRHGFLCESDSFYVSSDTFLTKRTGNLFRYIIARERRDVRAWIHSGDNMFSDIAMARGAGLNALHVNDARLTFFEQSLLRGHEQERVHFPSSLAGQMRAFRLRRSDHVSPPEQHYVGSFLGPTLFLFAHWLLSRAQAQSVSRLYFFSRDCYALHKVAEVLTKHFGGIECRYLMVSRQSLFLPSVSDISPAGIPWLIQAWERPVLPRIMKKLELRWAEERDDVLRHVGSLGDPFELETPEQVSAFWRYLQTDRVRLKLQKTIAERRVAALRYFRREGLFDGDEVAVVDLGWYLTCQASLRKILHLERPMLEVKGFYLGLQGDRLPPKEAGSSHAVFYSAPFDRAAELKNTIVFDRILVLEHLLACAPHGTVTSYSLNSGSDVSVDTMPISPQRREKNLLLADLVADFARKAEGAFGDDEDVNHCGLLERLLEAQMRKPDPQWMGLVGDISTSDDQNNIGAQPLCASYDAKTVVYSVLPRSLRPQRRDVFRGSRWPELSMAASPRWIRFALGATRALVAFGSRVGRGVHRRVYAALWGRRSG